MKKKYNEIEIKIYTLQADDIVTLSTSGLGEVEGDETKYPIPNDWA